MMSFVNSCAHPIFSSHHRIFICLLWMVWLDSSLLDTPLEQLEFISFTGSSISSSESDVAGMFFGDKTGDKMCPDLQIVWKKVNGAPIKRLIAQEMSKEVESTHNPPSLVAKLMGLDTLPHQQPIAATRRSHPGGYSRCSLSHSGIGSIESVARTLSCRDRQSLSIKALSGLLRC
uniref:DUF3741 domain-containing protein n=1 Tax=Salix viminalis TaxID=40686 RepID=A0A6N2KF79_SALVM